MILQVMNRIVRDRIGDSLREKVVAPNWDIETNIEAHVSRKVSVELRNHVFENISQFIDTPSLKLIFDSI